MKERGPPSLILNPTLKLKQSTQTNNPQTTGHSLKTRTQGQRLLDEST